MRFMQKITFIIRSIFHHWNNGFHFNIENEISSNQSSAAKMKEIKRRKNRRSRFFPKTMNKLKSSSIFTANESVEFI